MHCLIECDMRLSVVAKRPARENIENFLTAKYTLYGSKFFTYLFGQNMSKYIQEDPSGRFKIVASAFSGEHRVISVTAEQ